MRHAAAAVLRTFALAGLAAFSMAGPALAGPPLAVEAVGAKGDFPVDVGSFSWAQGRIPRRSAVEGRNIAPDLYWTGGPTGVKSYAVMIEDQDEAKDGAPVLHWSVFNLESTKLPEGGVWETPPPALRFGANGKGQPTYTGPNPPKGATHTYVMEVFDLDTLLDLPNGATRAQLLAAMKGHVLGAGSATAQYQQGAAF